MVVGVLRLTLHIEGAASLKDKRQVVRKVVDRLRSRFNVSVAEVGDNDIWQRARIGISAVANDHSFVNEVLDKCTRDAGNIAEILDREMEIETYGQMNADWSRKPDFEAHDLSRLPPEKDEELPEQQREAGWLKEEDLE
ncbi:MAG TPA: DUF503 domain-containing protein [Myxococcales bacterium]|nr:DUF503 domain-containing protein [Myxococcales bacterium]